MTRDLGTYWLRVELDCGGFLERWNTGHRYERGTDSVSPLDATVIKPTWNSEDDLFCAMVFMHTEGNTSCDCNRRLLLSRAAQEKDYDDRCGKEIRLLKLTAIRPDLSEVVLYTSS